MPNRILKESICTSESINRLSAFEEVVFYRLIVNCDDYGRMDGRSAVIKSRLFPLRDQVTCKAIDKAIRSLVNAGLVVLYKFEDKPYLYLPTWTAHQQVRAKFSKYPAPENSCMISYDINGNQAITNVPVIRNTIYDTTIYDTTTTTQSRACVREEAPVENSMPPGMVSVASFFNGESDMTMSECGRQAELFCAYNEKRGWDCLPAWKETARLWLARAPDFEGK